MPQPARHDADKVRQRSTTRPKACLPRSSFRRKDDTSWRSSVCSAVVPSAQFLDHRQPRSRSRRGCCNRGKALVGVGAGGRLDCRRSHSALMVQPEEECDRARFARFPRGLGAPTPTAKTPDVAPEAGLRRWTTCSHLFCIRLVMQASADRRRTLVLVVQSGHALSDCAG
jgi:hypothetical protein